MELEHHLTAEKEARLVKEVGRHQLDVVMLTSVHSTGSESLLRGDDSFAALVMPRVRGVGQVAAVYPSERDGYFSATLSGREESFYCCLHLYTMT